MEDLGLDVTGASTWFGEDQAAPFLLISVEQDVARTWPELLQHAVRRCYIADDTARQRATLLGFPVDVVVASKLPDPGSVMAGDFGEIVVYLFHAIREHPAVAIGPKKWRLKQERNKPAPKSDVLHLFVPNWPASSADDRLICSEVKVKSTASPFDPIRSAVDGSLKDRASRLAATLSWLRERAIGEDLGSVTLSHIDRFTNAVDHPPYAKIFSPVVLLCSSLASAELLRVPSPVPEGLVVIVIPGLKGVYESVFAAVRGSTIPPTLSTDRTEP